METPSTPNTTPKNRKVKKSKDEFTITNLIFVICCSVIAFVGLNFINCSFMIPGTVERSNMLGGLKNPPSLTCKDSQAKGYETLLSILTTVIALKTRVD